MCPLIYIGRGTFFVPERIYMDKAEKKESPYSRKRSHKAIAQICLSALYLALAIVLGAIAKFVPFLNMPNGGSISLAMVPLTLAALSLGPLYGTFIGLAYGVINMLMDGAASYHWLSLILDYFLAFSTVGIAGFLKKYYYKNKTWSLLLGLSIFGLLRFVCHFFSGVTVWSIASGNVNYDQIIPDFSFESVLFSLGYNATYVIPSVVIGSILLAVIAEPLFSMNHLNILRDLAPEQEEKFTKSSTFILDNISFYGLCASLIAALIGSLPLSYGEGSFMGYHYLGYFSLIFALFPSIFSVYRMIKSDVIYPEGTLLSKVFKSEKRFDLFLLIFSLITIALSITAICSYYTYAYDLYHPSAV